MISQLWWQHVLYAGLQSGFTALHVAARYGNHRVASVLIDFGADVNFVAKVELCHTSGIMKELRTEFHTILYKKVKNSIR